MFSKNDSISCIETASLLAVSSKLLSIDNIITLPAEANYSYQEILTFYYMWQHLLPILLNLQVISGQKIPNIRIPSVDTIFNYIKLNSIDNILSSFRKMNNNIFKMMDLKNKVHDIAIDFHDIPFYGCRDHSMHKGNPTQNWNFMGIFFLHFRHNWKF